MKLTLLKEDYESIAAIVRTQLLQLMPDNEFAKNEAIVFSPEFLSWPLRISTPVTRYKYEQMQNVFINGLRNEIKKNPRLTAQEKVEKNKQLNSIIMFGQLLFSQSASIHFLQKKYSNIGSDTLPTKIVEQLEQLKTLVDQEGILKNSSRLESLHRRRKFNKLLRETKAAVNMVNGNEQEKQALLTNLEQAKGFYYQVNDLNFKYANKSSRCFSKFVNAYSNIGGKISLAAAIIAIGATALALIPPLTPVMLPIAVVAAAIGLVVGTPLALKSLGTMLYNLIRFGASPTPSELINAILLATTVVLTGIGNLVGPDVANSEIFQSIKTTDNAGNTFLSTIGQVGDLSYQAQVDLYKSVLNDIKPPESVASKHPDTSTVPTPSSSSKSK